MSDEQPSAVEQFSQNVLARVGTLVGTSGAIATALWSLLHDVELTAAGTVLVIVLLGSAFVMLWRVTKIEGGKKIKEPQFAPKFRIVAGIVLGLGIIAVVPLSLQIGRSVNEMQDRERKLAELPFLALTPSPTRPPTPTLAPTLTLAPQAIRTATIQSLVSEAAAWPIAFADPFQSDSFGWSLGSFSNTDGSTKRNIANGKLHIELQTANNAKVAINGSTNTARMREFGDFYASVDIQSAGSKVAAYGLTFRENSAPIYNAYILKLRNDRSLEIRRWLDTDSSVGLLPDQATIKPEGVNRVVVIAVGSRFTILINGQFVTQFEDTALKKGKVGFWAGIQSGNEQATFDFSNFEIRAP